MDNNDHTMFNYNCPNGTFGKNCVDKCDVNYYGLRCQFKCNCFENETCNKATGCEEIINVNGTQPDFVQSRRKTSDIDIEDDDPYSEIRESMMVRPMTVYGRKLSIRSSYIDPDDQYHRIELATSLRKPNLDKYTIEYTDYMEPIDEPLLQPKNNIYEQLIIDELPETQRNSDNAIYAEVVKNQNNACSPQKHLNATESSDKCNLVIEVDNTGDKGDNYSDKETNTSEISDKTDVVIEIQDNTTYAKVVKNSNNECSSKIHLNTTGISDKLNFVTCTNKNEEISENSTKSKIHTTDNEGEMTTESESERKISSLQCEEENSNKNVVLNKIMSDYEDTPVLISVSVGKQTIFIDLKDRNVLNSLSNDCILENAITSVQMSTNVNKK
ncbi:unnamed protein product [Mytilus coruscus]|uniref:MEGF10_11 n=1 Tax=Mytilus coruscus TaxID=42192 RepID=A0A6J8EJV9_MYTCO|nr:unnamed protein product [Mytilus coruscus]